ncbi:MAG: hypothetical protein ACK5N8_00660 [Alphaproteobacteria bacterium]
MENLYFNFVGWIFSINFFVSIAILICYAMDYERSVKVNSCFRLFFLWLPFTIAMHIIAAVLGFCIEINALITSGSFNISFLVALCFSALFFIPICFFYMKQKRVFKSKEYWFRLEEVQDLGMGRYKFKGYITQDSKEYDCEMESVRKYAVGYSFKVDVLSIPFFGAFKVREHLDS